jgi:uncharacterized caspase-like protein
MRNRSLSRIHQLAHAVILILAVFTAPPACAKRIALVIGEASYEHAGSLPTPGNDAEDVAHALKRQGFEVSLGQNLKWSEMAVALSEFLVGAQDADVALLFYAGHSIQYNGATFLLPADAKLEDEFAIRREAFPLQIIMSKLGAADANIVLLDACRANPLAETLRSRIADGGSTIGADCGLERVARPSHSLIACSTASGPESLAETGRNSPFATALLKHIETPDLEAEAMLRRAVADVKAATAGRQRPQWLSELSAEVFLALSERRKAMEQAARLKKAEAARKSADASSIAEHNDDKESSYYLIPNDPRRSARHKFFKDDQAVDAPPLPTSAREASEREIGLTFSISPPNSQDRPKSGAALVIDNTAYGKSGTPALPANGAPQIADALRRANFSHVSELHNASRAEMLAELARFGAMADTVDFVLFYYNGYSVDIHGKNYLIPVDAKVNADASIEDQAIQLDLALREIHNGPKPRIFILDACAPNPFRALAGQKTPAGCETAPIETADGVYIAFAAKSGAAGLGETYASSVFTKAILHNIETPGMTFKALFRNVHREVETETGGKQEPFEYGFLPKNPSFLPQKASSFHELR